MVKGELKRVPREAALSPQSWIIRCTTTKHLSTIALFSGASMNLSKLPAIAAPRDIEDEEDIPVLRRSLGFRRGHDFAGRRGRLRVAASRRPDTETQNRMETECSARLTNFL